MKAMQLIAAAVLISGSSLALAQAGIGRTEVVRHDVGSTGQEAIQVRVDFAPGAAFGKHSHPGIEIAYVLEGTMEYQLAGQPPVTLKAGESLFIPEGTVHAAKNVGSGKASELATYFVQKNKQIVVPAE